MLNKIKSNKIIKLQFTHPYVSVDHKLMVRGVARISKGANNFFFSNMEICMSQSEAMRIARGVWGHALGEKFF